MFRVGHYLSEYVDVLERLDETMIETMAHELLAAWRGNNTVFCCGNGGSAATACHVAADLSKLTAPADGARLRVQALTESVAAISAIANDIAYEEIFAEQLRTFLQPGDVLIAFSTSGSSPNVISAVRYANSAAGITLGITGGRGVELKLLAQHALMVPSASVQQIEDASMVVGHLLCLWTRDLIAIESRELVGEVTRPVLTLARTDVAR